MAHEIINPTIDMARIFAREGLKATIISTPLNAPFVSSKIEKDRQLGLEIAVRIIKFPCLEAERRKDVKIYISLFHQKWLLILR
ncbi:hypothetical protein Patl1_24162 [Pistacia atlantica]|uniref:Uncharacterized protein n=1 Tax=Pistacia atlantica TaxID=434234 RepID=A0ACC1A1J1_9ROSI|nr:hypothetical protein Patl1_24162 [Pistacia atlantica]